MRYRVVEFAWGFEVQKEKVTWFGNTEWRATNAVYRSDFQTESGARDCAIACAKQYMAFAARTTPKVIWESDVLA